MCAPRIALAGNDQHGRAEATKKVGPCMQDGVGPHEAGKSEGGLHFPTGDYRGIPVCVNFPRDRRVDAAIRDRAAQAIVSPTQARIPKSSFRTPRCRPAGAPRPAGAVDLTV